MSQTLHRSKVTSKAMRASPTMERPFFIIYRWRIMSLFACMVIHADTRSRPFSSVHFLYVNSRGVHQKSQTDRTGLCKQVLSHNCLNSKLMMMTVFCRIGSARSRIKTVTSIQRCHCGSLTTPKLFYLHGLPNRQSHLKPEPLRHNGFTQFSVGQAYLAESERRSAMQRSA